MNGPREVVEALEDTSAIVDIAESTGLSIRDVRRVACAFAAIPIRQAIRICVTAQAEQLRETNRMLRRQG